MNNLTTLEDLKDFYFQKQMQEINTILAEFDLSNEEYEYVAGCGSASHQKTMINTRKAQEILLKRKK